MNTVPHVGGFPSELERVHSRLRENHLSAVRDLLTDKIILRACAEVGMQFGKRVLTPIVTVLHMIATAMSTNASNRSDSSFRSAWNAFGSEHVSSAALSKARGRLPEKLWQILCAAVGKVAAAASAPWASWRGHRVVDLDGTCVSMEDNPELKEAFGVNKGRHGLGRYPLARVVVAMLWGTMTIIDYAVGGYRCSEWALTASMLANLLPGDLLVGDRHFAAAHYYVIYARRGLQYLTRAHHGREPGAHHHDRRCAQARLRADATQLQRRAPGRRLHKPPHGRGADVGTAGALRTHVGRHRSGRGPRAARQERAARRVSRTETLLASEGHAC